MSNSSPDVPPSLIRRARRGDPHAFSALIRLYDRELRALAYRVLGDRDGMDDALQQAYLSAFRALPRFRGDSGLATWLYRIVYNACLDELKRQRNVVPLERIRDRPDPRQGIAETLPVRSGLAEALGELPPPDRAAVLLVDAYGFDYGSAAEILGVPEGTVGSRLNRARALLRAALDEPLEGVSEGEHHA
jgi:RNA polymerase sigma-70 factor (ECF subfamily)